MEEEPGSTPAPTPPGNPGAEPAVEAAPVGNGSGEPILEATLVGTTGDGPAPPAIVQAELAPGSVRGRDLLAGVGIIWAVELALAGVFILSGGMKAEGPTTPIMILLTTMLSTAAVFVVSWVFVCRKYGKSLAEGFAIRRVPARALLKSAAIGMASAVVAVALCYLFSTGESFMQELVSTPLGFAVMMFLALTVPPFEEIYYRGFIFPILTQKLGVVGGILLVTVWFGVAHAFQLAKDPIGLAIVVVMGLVWTLQRHLSRSLVPSIVSHWVYNAVLFTVSLLVQNGNG